MLRLAARVFTSAVSSLVYPSQFEFVSSLASVFSVFRSSSGAYKYCGKGEADTLFEEPFPPFRACERFHFTVKESHWDDLVLP